MDFDRFGVALVCVFCYFRTITETMKRFFRTNMGAALLNMLMAYVVFMVSRLAFFFENYATFAPDMSWGLALSMLLSLIHI